MYHHDLERNRAEETPVVAMYYAFIEVQGTEITEEDEGSDRALVKFVVMKDRPRRPSRWEQYRAREQGTPAMHESRRNPRGVGKVR